MNTRLFANLGLLALAIALGWYAFEIDLPPPAPPSVALTTLSVDAIKRIQIDRADHTVARLTRGVHEWRVRQPIDASADPIRVQILLGLARARSNSGFRASGNDLSQYGLQPPRASVQFDTTTLFIGDTDPIAGHRYVMVGDQVHLLEDNWFAQIFGSATAWLDPRLLPHGATPLRIELRGAAQHGQSAGHSPGQSPGHSPANGLDSAQWQRVDKRWLRTPVDAAANAQQTEQRGAALAKAWRQARALSVRPRDAALNWSGHVVIVCKLSPRRAAPSAPRAATPQPAKVAADDAATTIVFQLAHTADALFLAREDLGVQYRFLPRQGDALLGVNTAK